MSNLNRVTIEGRLTRDPETKVLPSGKRVCIFAVAVNYGTKDKDGTWKNDNLSGFFDCSAWEDVAKLASAFKKGSAVYVEGWLKQDRWQDADGKARSNVFINVREIRMAEWAKKKASSKDVPVSGQEEAALTKAGLMDDFQDDIPF